MALCLGDPALRKAFDSVPHMRLLVKLQAHGIKGKLLNWIQSFLTNRKQRVIINGSQSDESAVISGVTSGVSAGATTVCDLCE